MTRNSFLIAASVTVAATMVQLLFGGLVLIDKIGWQVVPALLAINLAAWVCFSPEAKP